MSNANTGISSLAVSHVSRLCNRIAVYQEKNTWWLKSLL